MASLVYETIRMETPQTDHCNIEIIYHEGTSTSNTPGTGPPAVILLPYWGGTARTYGILQTRLARLHPNLTTIAISYPGTGRSSHDVPHFDIEDPAQMTPINNLALTVTSLLRMLTARSSLINSKAGIILLGHSMGAKIASAVLATPSRTDCLTKALVLLAPAPPVPMALDLEERTARAHAYDSLEIAKYVIKEKLTLVHASESVLSELAEDAVSMSPEAKAQWMQHGIGEDVTPGLAALRSVSKMIEIRILAGALDKVESIQQIQLVTIPAFKRLGFGNVRIEEVRECGHLVPVEDSGVTEVTRVLLEVLDVLG